MQLRNLTVVLVSSLGFMTQACMGMTDEDFSDEEIESLELAGEGVEGEIESQDSESDIIEPTAEAPNCRLVADPPWLAFNHDLNKWVFMAAGGREDCEQFRPRITVKIREDIPWLPDEDFVSRDFSGINGVFFVMKACQSPLDDATYFTEVSTNAGGKGSSARVYLDCPGPN